MPALSAARAPGGSRSRSDGVLGASGSPAGIRWGRRSAPKACSHSSIEGPPMPASGEPHRRDHSITGRPISASRKRVFLPGWLAGEYDFVLPGAQYRVHAPRPFGAQEIFLVLLVGSRTLAGTRGGVMSDRPLE